MTSEHRLTVTLVRHGETLMNVSRLVQGHTDAPLSDQGIQQAQKLGRYAKDNNISFSNAYASDLQRAYITAQQILQEAGSNLTVKKDIKLRERGYGDAEGKPFSDYALRAKKANSRVPDFVPPGAESIPELRNRVKDTFEFLCNQSKTIDQDQNLLVVSHGGWIQCFMYYLYDSQDKFKLQNFNPSSAVTNIHHNTGVTQMRISPLVKADNQQAEYQVEFLRLNDISHLS